MKNLTLKVLRILTGFLNVDLVPLTIVVFLAHLIIGVALLQCPIEPVRAAGFLILVTALLAGISLIGLLISHGDPAVNFISYLLGSFTDLAAVLAIAVSYPIQSLLVALVVIGVYLIIKYKPWRWNIRH